jgi:hypothetical protein
MKERKTQPPSTVEKSAPAADPSASGSPSDSAATSSPAQPGSKSDTNLGVALLGLAFIGLASPFLELQDPIHGIIGLVILFVGIRIAWQLTAGPKVDILGPFTVGVSSPPPPTS